MTRFINYPLTFQFILFFRVNFDDGGVSGLDALRIVDEFLKFGLLTFTNVVKRDAMRMRISNF